MYSNFRKQRNFYNIRLQISQGRVSFSAQQSSVQLDDDVSDGLWHYVEAKWRSDGSVLLRLDHGLRKVRAVHLRLNRA